MGLVRAPFGPNQAQFERPKPYSRWPVSSAPRRDDTSASAPCLVRSSSRLAVTARRGLRPPAAGRSGKGARRQRNASSGLRLPASAPPHSPAPCGPRRRCPASRPGPKSAGHCSSRRRPAPSRPAGQQQQILGWIEEHMKLFWVGEEMKLEMCLMWFYCANQS